jgi:hypothetical protein
MIQYLLGHNAFDCQTERYIHHALAELANAAAVFKDGGSRPEHGADSRKRGIAGVSTVGNDQTERALTTATGATSDTM